MKPVAVFRHIATEGAGYFADFLTEQDIPYLLIKIDEDETIPTNPLDYSGLVFMGGSMSVNDNLPWISDSLNLIRAAIAADVPVLGHCLGGQLISKALGAVVKLNPVKEIGWGNVTTTNNDVARAWFDGLQQYDSFHWHGETFELPEGAVHILKSAYCENQAYAIGKHLALQCHVEMTAEMVKTWSENGIAEINAASVSPAVQTLVEIQSELDEKVTHLNRVADRLYSRWLKGLKC
ncbi:type 1 glutamine amidotransferase [Sulfuriferula nivalis]|uniref:GMP synthase n=1 Tax=Sulfuriferula nivalis TaxID=2675298 RepID=A0A809SDX0_9PROT|nr:type 1 glutamine amidotransferase [Sulfuriferula nivalis]BBP00927.1 GMP synthase [Sulfuriferula nivalis]